MAVQQKRRTLLLAVLLALLAAGTLCVWGAAAAGFSITSPALNAAIDAFTNARAGDGDMNGNGGGDVNISLPGGGDDGGDSGDGDGDEGDTGGGDGDGSDAGGNDCFLGILCLNTNVNATSNANGSTDGNLLDADVNAEGDEAGGLNIGGLHINATGDVEDGEAALAAAASATGNEGSCFLDLICLTANADAATNDATGANLDVNAYSEDGDINLDVLGGGQANTDSNSDSFLDSILNLFVNADAN